MGTLPSCKSLEKKEYYGNPQNKFWEIVFSIFNSALPEIYEEKCSFLLKNKIALWDVLLCGERKRDGRESSLDSDIKNESPNNLEELFTKYPNIELVVLTSTDTEKYFKKYFKNINVKYIRVSSPSPANAQKKLDDKKAEWKKALNLLIQ